MTQRLKCLPAMRETWVRSLVQEDPLEKEMATHSNILAWRIPWMEELGLHLSSYPFISRILNSLLFFEQYLNNRQ